MSFSVDIFLESRSDRQFLAESAGAGAKMSVWVCG